MNSSPSASEHSAVSQLSILVVDDDPAWQLLYREQLADAGFHVRFAHDGGQARSEVERYRPDVVLLDLMLPGVNGFELCETFKKREPNLPVVIVSVMDRHDARDLGNRSGADGYVVKPWDIEQLSKLIRELAAASTSEPELSPAERRSIRLECPACGHRYRVGSKHRGRTMACPDCGEAITIPKTSP